MNVRALLDARLLLVTGKGGTGKTTVSAALGRLAAAQGRRSIVVEIDSFRPALTRVLGVRPGYAPTAVSARLDICNITWEEALEEWLEHSIPAGRVVRHILDNAVVRLFLDATPLARETVILSRLRALYDTYDQVIVDMPASGHAVSLLRVPRVALDLMEAGPIRERALETQEMLDDPRTAMVVVALPEEMVVNETIELWHRIRSELPQLGLPMVALNRAVVPSLSLAERSLLERLSAASTGGAAAELLRSGRWEASLEAATAEATRRLRTDVGDDLIEFSRLGMLGGFDGGPLRIVQQMVAALQRAELAEVSR